MRMGTLSDRVALITGDTASDLATASDGKFGPAPLDVLDHWDEVRGWAAENTEVLAEHARPFDEAQLGAPVPLPRQVFAIGLNYRDHAAEADMATPESDPLVFTKFPTSVAGPYASVELPSANVDFEAELVVVIGARAHRVSRADGWQYVAGLTVGQDISERVVQFRGPTPQFNLGKSYPGFSPIGPVLVTPDEFADRDDVELGCSLAGQRMQQGHTRNLIFTIPALIESISAIVPLLPGDLIFTGTPAGIGWARDPKVLLRPGQELRTYAEGIGEIRTTFTASDNN